MSMSDSEEESKGARVQVRRMKRPAPGYITSHAYCCRTMLLMPRAAATQVVVRVRPVLPSEIQQEVAVTCSPDGSRVQVCLADAARGRGSSQPECGTAVAAATAQRMLQPVLTAKEADRQARRMWTHGLSPASGQRHRVGEAGGDG